MTTESHKKQKYEKAKLHAKETGLGFTLTFAEYLTLIGDKCYLCDEPATEPKYNCVWLERYPIGYNKSNCKTMCFFCLQTFGLKAQGLDLLFAKVRKIAAKHVIL